MVIGSENHLLNCNCRTENEGVNCQKHERNTRIKCISFPRRRIPWKEIESNRSLIPTPILNRNTLTQALCSSVHSFCDDFHKYPMLCMQVMDRRAFPIRAVNPSKGVLGWICVWAFQRVPWFNKHFQSGFRSFYLCP